MIPLRPRPSVYWLGEPATAEQRRDFTERGLELVDVADASVGGLDWAHVRACVIRHGPATTVSPRDRVEAVAPPAFDHGAAVYLLADDDGSLQALVDVRQRISEAKKLGEHRFLLMGPASFPTALAETIARHDAGPAFQPLEIEGDVDCATTRLLLARAFRDCRKISVTRLEGGKTDARVYSVRAIFSNSRSGPFPLPFFVKADSPKRIQQEREHYRDYVDDFIPFNLMPHIAGERCVGGAARALLVGNFVERSEPLHEVIRRGPGPASSALHSLFEDTLRGWRVQGFENVDVARNERPMFDEEMKKGVEPRKVPAETKKLATELGCVMNPKEILATLESSSNRAHFRGPIHGDLSGTNVRVRGTDAILIDFYSTRPGPITADPAYLEASIIFEPDSGEEDPTDQEDAFKRWRPVVDRLFDRRYLEFAPPPPQDVGPREWLWSSVRLIRKAGLESQLEQGEYRLMLAFALLRRTMHDLGNRGFGEWRRAYALVLADRLLR